MEKNGKKARKAGPVSDAAGLFDRGRDYIVYWRTGLKSRCSGYPLTQAADFYLSRARLILDAETRKQVYAAD